MKSRTRSVLEKMTVPVLFVAIIAMGAHITWRSYVSSQIDHQYQLALRAVAKAGALGVEDEVAGELEAFFGASPKDLDEVMQLGARVRAIVDAALDEKYKDRVSVYPDELRDRAY